MLVDLPLVSNRVTTPASVLQSAEGLNSPEGLTLLIEIRDLLKRVVTGVDTIVAGVDTLVAGVDTLLARTEHLLAHTPILSTQLTQHIVPATPASTAAIPNRIFVGNLAWAIDNDSLRAAFSAYGQITDSIVPKDRDTQRSRGFGFVTYASAEEAQAAIRKMHGQYLKGRQVRVNLAYERRSGGNFGGKSGGQSSSCKILPVGS
ncbi:hypothetical protein HDV00_001386 [Rhizophlyctis rosea]|nr:hypothetical protein HDV00_001386 [Rhizophlyctis rosea]